MEASTPRGRRRRDALVEAAAALLLEAGPEAVTARAVAGAAGVTLGAVTYYFEDLAALRRAAAALLAERHLRVAQEAVAELSATATTPEVAGALVSAVLGPYATAGPDGVRALYARALSSVAARELAPQAASWDARVADVVADGLRSAGRRAERARAVLACVDGAAVAAVLAGVPAPAARMTDQVAEVLDLLAPPA